MRMEGALQETVDELRFGWAQALRREVTRQDAISLLTELGLERAGKMPVKALLRRLKALQNGSEPGGAAA